MNVLLVLPWCQTDKSYKTFAASTMLTYAPLTLGALGAIIKNARPDWNVEAIDEVSGTVRYDRKKYDMVFISLITSAAKRGYDIADKFRAIGSFVCMGGYHVRYNREEALEHADSVIIGPGEYAIPALINDYEKHKTEKIYEMPNVKGEDILPVDRSLISMKGYLKYPALVANNSCKNRCDYCVISDMWKASTPRPVSDVIEEIKSLKKKIIIFFDPNFFGNREYAIELMMALSSLKIRWVGSATANIGFDDELLGYAEKSGCNGLLIGLESMKKETLVGVRKGFNDPLKYKESIANIQAHGISVNGCFIVGMDGDTKEDIMSLPEQIRYLNLNLARFAVMTPVPGTEFFKKLDENGRITDKNWDRYTQHNAVFTPIGYSADELNKMYRYVWKETYSFKNLLCRVKNCPSRGIVAKMIVLGANIGFKYLGMK